MLAVVVHNLEDVMTTGATDFLGVSGVEEWSPEKNVEGSFGDDLDLHVQRSWSQLNTLGARGPGNCQKHLENIAGCGSNFLQCNC